MNLSKKNSAVVLLIGCLLLLMTIILHPAGGSIKHIISSSSLIIFSHSVALLSIPFFLVGFWGLHNVLSSKDGLVSLLAFAFLAMMQVAGMIAAAINGLAMPLLLNGISDPTANESLSLILKSMLALNQAFDYIFIVGAFVAILLWSDLIIKIKPFAPWVGYFGALTAIVALLVVAFGSAQINLHTFRLFMSAYFVWTVWVSISLYRAK